MEKKDIMVIIEMLSKDTCEFEKRNLNEGSIIRTSRGVEFIFDKDGKIKFIRAE